MRVEPAHVDQIRRGSDGRMVPISGDAGGVAEELARIHPGLKVRFCEAGQPPYWAVFFESEDGHDTYLITTAEAWQGSTGVWEGLDHRLVDRIRKVDREGRSGYDYAQELQNGTRRARERAQARFRERMGEHAEQAAHAIRKDLGERYKGRAFIPRAI